MDTRVARRFGSIGRVSTDGDRQRRRSIGRRRPTAQRARGQVLVIFAGAMFLFVGLSALVIDVSWYWVNNLHMQKAADAAALAGAVYLPGDPSIARTTALAEARANGYVDGTAGVSITADQDATNDRQLDVRISGPVGTFFMRVLGISSIPAARTSVAEFVLPVPMGSPENYYGVFGNVRNATMTTTGTTTQDHTATAPSSGLATASAYYPNGGSGNWSNPSRADGSNNGSYAVSTTTNGSAQAWGNFGLTFTTPVKSIDGITVQFRALISGSGSPTTNCQLLAQLSWDNGVTWTAAKSNTLSTSKVLKTAGASNDTWGRTWSDTELANGSFRVKLTWNKVSCGGSRTASVDTLGVTVDYTYTTTTTGTTTTTATYPLTGPGAPCANGAADCYQATPAAGGQTLNARGFWAEMNSQGAENINGDAFQPYYDTRTSGVSPACPAANGRACFGPDDYYNYGIYMPPNTTGGYVYIYDPVFCATGLSDGTGDRWYGGSNAVSSFYELYDMSNTPYDLSDDTQIVTSGNEFRQVAASDTTMSGSGGSQCRQSDQPYGDGRDYHDAWYLLNPNDPLTGGPNGTTYRLHTMTTDPNNPSQQLGTNAEQNFAIYATDAEAPTTYPQVYGLGAMQMFTPLSASGSPKQSEFYLAQIAAVHAGKTLEIGLWDPGDTNNLTAYIEILRPTDDGLGWTHAEMTYSAKTGTTNSGRTSSCNSNTGTKVTSITTNNGSNLFNGCWLTIDIKIPDGYLGKQDGWWKIRYTMNGNDTSSDVTTWTATIQGNPVHLVYP